MNDLISEYQQYQEATIDDDEYDGEGDDLEQDEAQLESFQLYGPFLEQKKANQCLECSLTYL